MLVVRPTRLENTLNYGMERVWSIAYIKGSNSVGVGMDEGAVVVKIGREEPVGLGFMRREEPGGPEFRG